MRRLRRLSMAVVLALMLGTYALAGTIETPPGTIETPPAPQASATGTIETPPSAALPVALATDPVMDIALDLFQSALSLL
jgi:hypothetical protein